MRRSITIRAESWPAIIPFRISNHVWDDFPCIVCEIEQDGLRPAAAVAAFSKTQAHAISFHLIEHPMDGIWSRGP